METNEENKNDKFKRIANKRTNNVLKSLRSLAKLSNTRNYEYSRIEVRKIFSAINDELKVSRALFDKNQMGQFEL